MRNAETVLLGYLYGKQIVGKYAADFLMKRQRVDLHPCLSSRVPQILNNSPKGRTPVSIPTDHLPVSMACTRLPEKNSVAGLLLCALR